MKAIAKIYYVSECGKTFGNPLPAINHESVCKCWTNLKFKTCKTCRFSKVFKESVGDDFFSATTYYRECQNPKMKPELFTPAHEKAQDVCINCPKWRKDDKKNHRKATLKNKS